MATIVEFLLSGFTDNSGEPLASGKVYTYAAGTTTDKATYTDNLGATPEANPVILDSNGRKQIYGDGSYKFVVKDSDDVTLYTFDNLYFGDGAGVDFLGSTTGSSGAYIGTPTPAISAYVDGRVYEFQANHTNPSAATLNISGLGAKTITGIVGHIVSGFTYLARYSSGDDRFYLVNDDHGYATTQAEMSAINAIGSEIVIRQAITLTSALTLTAPLRIEEGGSIVTGAYLLTINGPFKAGMSQCFSTQLSKVAFGAGSCEKIYPQWFGAVADGATDSDDYINFALSSLVNGGTLSFPTGSYVANSTLSIITSNVKIEGNDSTISFTSTSFGIAITGTGVAQLSNIEIEKLKLIQLTTASANGSQQALHADHVQKVRLRGLYIQDWAVGIKFNDNCQFMWVDECHLKNIGEGGTGGIAIYCEGEDGTVGYSNDHFYATNNYVDGCIYGVEAKYVTDIIIQGNIVENTTGSKYAFEIVRDTANADTSQRGIISNNIGRNLTGEGVFAKGVNITVSNNVIENCTGNAYHLSGSNMTMSGNIAYNVNTGGSIVYDSTAVKSGFEALVDTAKFIVTNNLFMLVTGSDPAITFNECSESLISNNMIYDMTGADYCYHLDSCVGSIVVDNVAHGGTFGYRLDTDSTGLTFRGNKSSGYSSGEVSLPGDHPGWTIENGDYQSRYFPRLQTADATPVALASYTIDTTNTSVHLKAKVNCKSSSGVAVTGAYDIECLVSRTTGNLSIIGSVGSIFSAETDAGLDATFTVSSNVVSVTVTGKAATSLNWEAVVELIKNH